ncbi:hypothetical protein [Pectinatus cerevisiiphilus]|nr:hypothetical protein [Pectinatus cerevisiiphilus]
MQNFTGKNIESLILGCTHYPIIKDILSKHIEVGIKLIDPAVSTIEKAVSVMQKNNMLNPAKTGGRMEFFFSSAPDHAAHMVKIVMGIDNPFINNIDLDRFN